LHGPIIFWQDMPLLD